MESHEVKQQIICENRFENIDIERELLNPTPYELLVIDISKDDLLASFSSKPVAIVNTCIPITAEILSQIPSSVKVITELRVGYNKAAAKMCRERNIEVCHVLDYGTGTVADHAVGLVFATQRRLLTFHKSIVDQHQRNYRIAGRLRNLNLMTLGIIGYGRIGRCFADRIRPFVKEEILVHNSKDSTTNTMKEIFERYDIISIHIPYSIFKCESSFDFIGND